MIIANTKLLTELRQKRGWSQYTMAKTTGIPRSCIQRAEKGEPVSITSAIAISNALEVPKNTLFKIIYK